MSSISRIIRPASIGSGFKRLLAAKGEQLRGQLCTPRNTRKSIGHARLLFEIIVGELSLQQLEVPADDLQKIVEIVRHTPGQLPHGFHLLRLHELPLQQFAFLDFFFDTNFEPLVEVFQSSSNLQLFRNFARFDDRPDSLPRPVFHRRRGESDRIERSVLVNENLFALRLVIFRKCPVDRAFCDRKWPPIRIGVMEDIVQGSSACFGKRIAAKLFSRLVHERAVLLIVQHKDGHRRIAQNRVQANGDLAQRPFNRLAFGGVFDRSKEHRLAIGPDQLQSHHDIVKRAILALVHGLEIEPVFCAGDERLYKFQEFVLAKIGLDVPRRSFAQFVHRKTKVFAGTAIDQREGEIFRRKHVNLACRIFYNSPQALARYGFCVRHVVFRRWPDLHEGRVRWGDISNATGGLRQHRS